MVNEKPPQSTNPNHQTTGLQTTKREADSLPYLEQLWRASSVDTSSTDSTWETARSCPLDGNFWRRVGLWSKGGVDRLVWVGTRVCKLGLEGKGKNHATFVCWVPSNAKGHGTVDFWEEMLSPLLEDTVPFAFISYALQEEATERKGLHFRSERP